MRAYGFRVMAVCGALIWAPAMAAGNDKTWSAEVGVSPGHSNNFFSRGSARTRVPSDVLNIYGTGEIERQAGKGEVKISLRADAIFASDIDDADHQRFTLGAQYKRGRNRISGELFTNPDRLSFFEEQQQAVNYDIQGYEIAVRRNLRPGIWVRVAYESETWDWEEIENDRDSDKETVSATVRFPVGKRSGIRASLFSETKDANAPSFNRDGEGFSLRLDTRLRKDLRLATRYKRSDRNYKDAPEDGRNFMREDTVEEFMVRVRWSLARRWLARNRRLAGERWGVQLRERIRTGDSTREDRNFSSNRIEAGVYFVF